MNGPDREEQEMIDKVKMDEVKTALQSQIVPDDEEEEISQEHIEDLKKQSSESRREENQDLFTPSMMLVKSSQAPEIRSFNPEEHLANHELPKWFRYPEPVPFDSQDEAGCQDTGKGSSELMDRYVIRCMAQVIKPMYTSFHQTGVTIFRETFLKKRLDVMSDFTKGVSNGFDEDDMPKDPTEQQMQVFAKSKGVNLVEAWHMLQGEQMIGKFALQATSFGYTPTTFKEEFGETDRPPPGTVQSMVESSKRAKQLAMSTMVRKCMNAIYSVTSYSYFRDELSSNDMRKCIDPQDVMSTSGTE